MIIKDEDILTIMELIDVIKLIESDKRCLVVSFKER